ncbi:MAG: hypothetical protein K2H82_05525 [Oscillospiraceae bacterium]|nr:hypothetical protein [Oscillospiraceae bacterium]
MNTKKYVVIHMSEPLSLKELLVMHKCFINMLIRDMTAKGMTEQEIFEVIENIELFQGDIADFFKVFFQK